MSGKIDREYYSEISAHAVRHGLFNNGYVANDIRFELVELLARAAKTVHEDAGWRFEGLISGNNLQGTLDEVSRLCGLSNDDAFMLEDTVYKAFRSYIGDQFPRLVSCVPTQMRASTYGRQFAWARPKEKNWRELTNLGFAVGNEFLPAVILGAGSGQRIEVVGSQYTYEPSLFDIRPMDGFNYADDLFSEEKIDTLPDLTDRDLQDLHPWDRVIAIDAVGELVKDWRVVSEHGGLTSLTLMLKSFLEGDLGFFEADKFLGMRKKMCIDSSGERRLATDVLADALTEYRSLTRSASMPVPG